MCILRNKVLTGLILFLLLNYSLAFADEGVSDTKALREEVALLKEQINALEARLKATETKVAATPVATGTSLAQETGLSSTITSFAKEVEVHGFDGGVVGERPGTVPAVEGDGSGRVGEVHLGEVHHGWKQRLSNNLSAPFGGLFIS